MQEFWASLPPKLKVQPASLHTAIHSLILLFNPFTDMHLLFACLISTFQCEQSTHEPLNAEFPRKKPYLHYPSSPLSLGPAVRVQQTAGVEQRGSAPTASGTQQSEGCAQVLSVQ